MIPFNENLFLWINHRFASPLMDGAMSFITVTGDSAVAISFGLMAVLLYSRAPARTAGLFLLAMSIGGGAMHAIKQNLPQDRPLAHFEDRIKSGEVAIRAPYVELYHRTFPSGHTQTAFTAAVFLALLIRRPAPIAALFVWASMVGFSRIYLGAHFPLDVAGGALLGALSGWLVYRLCAGWAGAQASIKVDL